MELEDEEEEELKPLLYVCSNVPMLFKSKRERFQPIIFPPATLCAVYLR